MLLGKCELGVCFNQENSCGKTEKSKIYLRKALCFTVRPSGYWQSIYRQELWKERRRYPVSWVVLLPRPAMRLVMSWIDPWSWMWFCCYYVLRVLILQVGDVFPHFRSGHLIFHLGIKLRDPLLICHLMVVHWYAHQSFFNSMLACTAHLVRGVLGVSYRSWWSAGIFAIASTSLNVWRARLHSSDWSLLRNLCQFRSWTA